MNISSTGPNQRTDHYQVAPNASSSTDTTTRIGQESLANSENTSSNAPSLSQRVLIVIKPEDLRLTMIERGSAVIIASSANNLTRVQELLRSGNISRGDRFIALLSASQKGILGIVQELLQSNDLLEADRGAALGAAAKNSHLTVTLAILGSGPVSIDGRTAAACQASINGRLDILLPVLESGHIYKESREVSVNIAYLFGRLEIVKALLNHGPISKERSISLLLDAGTNGDITLIPSIVDNILERNPGISF